MPEVMEGLLIRRFVRSTVLQKSSNIYFAVFFACVWFRAEMLL